MIMASHVLPAIPAQHVISICSGGDGPNIWNALGSTGRVWSLDHQMVCPKHPPADQDGWDQQCVIKITFGLVSQNCGCYPLHVRSLQHGFRLSKLHFSRSVKSVQLQCACATTIYTRLAEAAQKVGKPLQCPWLPWLCTCAICLVQAMYGAHVCRRSLSDA